MDEQTTSSSETNDSGVQSAPNFKMSTKPLKFKSAEELQQKIDKYFEETPKDEWTITGLAMALDTSRKVLCEYEEKDEYSNTVKKAKLKVENGYEIDLKKHGRTGTIFALKNFDWKDKNETDINLRTPKPLDDVSEDDSLQQNKADESENQSDTGGNVSE